MKNYTKSDLTKVIPTWTKSFTPYCRLTIDKEEDMFDKILPWMKRGLSKTASGYGSKIPTQKMFLFEGRARRIYVTIFSNHGSLWFNYKGQRILIS